MQRRSSFDAANNLVRVTTSSAANSATTESAISQRLELEVDELIGPSRVEEDQHDQHVGMDRRLRQPRSAEQTIDLLFALEPELEDEHERAVEDDQQERRERQRRRMEVAEDEHERARYRGEVVGAEQ